MRPITELEYSLIETKARNAAERIGSTDSSMGFLHLVLEAIFPRADEEISSLITDGSGDRGADAIYIQESDNAAYVSIVQSKYASTLKGAKKNFPGAEVDKLTSLIRNITDRDQTLIESVNPILREKIKDIWRLVDLGRIIFIKVFFVSNCQPMVAHERNRFDEFCRMYEFVSLEELSFQEIVRLISTDRLLKENGTLDTVDMQKYERSDCDIRGLIANIDALSYIKMISSESGSIKRHLFDENIRGFLGIDGGYNRQIVDSSLSDENHLFWYLNNGITIVASSFTHQKVRGSKIHLSDFQIVNGAQTSYSLLEAYKRDPDKVAEVVLLVKIFASSRSDISEQIAIATNSQARIFPRDLKANDPIQKKIAAIFEGNNLLYERKKNQFDFSDDRIRIDSLKLGQAILAYRLKEPHLAKTSSDEIFGIMYNRIFSESLDGKYITRLARLYLFVSESREGYLSTLRRHETLDSSNDFIAYTQWYIMYCIAMLSEMNGIDVPEEHEFSEYFEKAKFVVSRIANKYREESFYRIFRSARTKDLIMNELGVGQLRFEF